MPNHSLVPTQKAGRHSSTLIDMKTITKKQHYIPQYFLKNFSIDNLGKSVFIYDVASQNEKTQNQNRRNIENFCQKKYFYGKDNIIENFLSIRENLQAPIISNIITHNNILNEHKNVISEVFVDFLIRLPHIKESFEEIFGKIEKDSINQINYNQQMKEIMESAPASLRLLAAILIVNKSRVKFIISDQPITTCSKIINSPPHVEHNYVETHQKLFLLPISPELIICMYNKSEFEPVDMHKGKIEIKNSDIIEKLNVFKFSGSENVIYSDDHQLDSIIGSHRLFNSFIKGKKPNFELINNELFFSSQN